VECCSEACTCLQALEASRCVLEARAAVGRMQEAVSAGTTLQVVTTEERPPKPANEASIQGSITFQAVCFAYPSNLDVPVLRCVCPTTAVFHRV
jgi:ABC-type multidrug transport system fused ATPase/permease subunit